jgi:hypothetical protein
MRSINKTNGLFKNNITKTSTNWSNYFPSVFCFECGEMNEITSFF